MRLKAKFSSTYCNNWPKLKIKINNEIICHTEVINELTLDKIIDIADVNTLEIYMLGKRFGPIWDTKTVNNIIISDQTLTLTSFELDEVDIVSILNKLNMNIIQTGNSPQADYINHQCKFNFNSFLSITFTSPVYDWIITEKYIKNSNLTASENSFGSWNNKFNYTATREYLEKIKLFL